MAKRTTRKKRNSLRVRRSKNKKSYYTRKRIVKRKLSHNRKFSKSKKHYKHRLQKTKKYKRIKGGSSRKVGGNIIEIFKRKKFVLFQKIDSLLEELRNYKLNEEFVNLNKLRGLLSHSSYYLEEEV